MEKRHCLVCGQPFTPITGNNLYCGPTCAKTGNARKRKEWEARSGYREKKRIEAQQRREAIKAAEQAEREAALQRRLEQLSSDRSEPTKTDPFSQMLESGKNGNRSPEYWEAYKAYSLAWAKQFGKIDMSTVNGIPIISENFGQLVSDSIAESGRILVLTEYVKNPSVKAP